MRSGLTGRLLLTALAIATANTRTASAQMTQDERAIRALLESHAVAWNRRDVKAASDVYGDTTTIGLGSGRLFIGRAGVEQWHTDALTGPTPSTHTHPPETIRLHFVAPDVAVADVESHSPGPLGTDGQPGPTRKAQLFVVLTRTGGQWRVVAQRPTTLPVRP